MTQVNWLMSNYSLTATGVAVPTYETEFNAGDVVNFEVTVEALTGAPSAAALAVKFQVSPIEYRGYNLDWTTTGDPQAWQDVAAADTYLGKLLVDGDWPASLADQTFTTVVRGVARRFIVPPINCLVRLALTPTFTGGTSPAFKVTVCNAV